MNQNRTLWMLVLLQALPLLVVLLAATGLLDPISNAIGDLEEAHIDGVVHVPEFTQEIIKFISAYWFLCCIAVVVLGVILTIIHVGANRSLSMTQRAIWIAALVLGQTICVLLYCGLGLVSSLKAAPSSAA